MVEKFALQRVQMQRSGGGEEEEGISMFTSRSANVVLYFGRKRCCRNGSGQWAVQVKKSSGSRSKGKEVSLLKVHSRSLARARAGRAAAKAKRKWDTSEFLGVYSVRTGDAMKTV